MQLSSRCFFESIFVAAMTGAVLAALPLAAEEKPSQATELAVTGNMVDGRNTGLQGDSVELSYATCPGGSGVRDVVVTSYDYDSGTTINCGAPNSLIIGPDVSVINDTVLKLDSPAVSLRGLVSIQAGSQLHVVQQPTCYAVQAMAEYITENLCKNPYATPPVDEDDLECLEIIEFKTCDSGCWRKMYNYRSWQDRAGNLEFHMSLEYLRELRSNLETELSLGETCTHDLAFGGTISDMLWTQVQATMRHPQTRFHEDYTGADWSEIALDDVIASKSVDPTMFKGLTFTTGRFEVGPNQDWSTGEGYSEAYYDATGDYIPTSAHAMTQADAMLWFAQIGNLLNIYGLDGSYYLMFAERLFAAYAVPYRFGGVRNDKMGFRCWDNRYCYFYHSREQNSYDFAASVLNKNLHAIRDAMETAQLLQHWQDYGTCNCSNAPYPGKCVKRFAAQSVDNGYGAMDCTTAGGTPGVPFPTGILDNPNLAGQMLEAASGGLFNLAWSTGNTSDIGRPPNLDEFLKDTKLKMGDYYYVLSRSAYQYWMNDNVWEGELLYRGPADGTANNACHYHYHSMDVFRRIFDLGEKSHYLKDNQDFIDAHYGLLYGRDRTEGDINIVCLSPASNDVRGVPLAELYLSAKTPNVEFQLGAWSQTPPTNDPEDYEKCWDSARRFLLGGSGDPSVDARAYFDNKYKNCKLTLDFP